jgi:hypothetical protein
MVTISYDDSGYWYNTLTRAFLSLQADVLTQNPFSLQAKANETVINILNARKTD